MDDLSAEIRRRIASGVLPRGPGLRTFAGNGEGQPCDGCGRRIGETDVQYQIDFESSDGAQDGRLQGGSRC
jgi:hypothetical protein